MSVVLATPGSFAGVHTTVAALTAQTARDRLELVLVTPRRAVLQPDGAVLGAFGWHQVVEVADFGSLGPANAAGVRAARAPIVALAEDHCFPDPDWAQHLISAHEGPWAA
ncbi:MAG: glycosyltransferase family 2 protein, partial [Gemmatimonadaceae bacterium]